MSILPQQILPCELAAGSLILRLLLLANGCDLSVLVRCTPHAEATVTRWPERMGAHSARLHGRMFQKLVIPLLQLDELHARVRREGVQWLWVGLDPVKKVIPTFHLGPRTTEAAMHFVDQLGQVLAPGCVPAFTTDGLRAYFYALTAHFGQWHRELGQRKAPWQVSDTLLHGQLVKRKRQEEFAIMRMAWGTRAELSGVLRVQGFSNRVCRTGEFDPPPRGGPADAQNLGICPNHGPSSLTSRMVAGLLSLELFLNRIK